MQYIVYRTMGATAAEPYSEGAVKKAQELGEGHIVVDARSLDEAMQAGRMILEFPSPEFPGGFEDGETYEQVEPDGDD